MTNLCKVTVAMLSLAIAGGFAITPSRADTVFIQEHRMLVPAEERVLVQPMVIPDTTVRTFSMVVPETFSTSVTTPYTVETRYGNVRLFERATILPSTTHVELLY